MKDFRIYTQPDDETCGPTCLHAIYSYFGHHSALEEIVDSVERSHSGGTLASMLGKHALQKGFKAEMYVNNLSVFDPSWFQDQAVSSEFLISKLKIQMKYKRTKHFIQASKAYIEFIKLGGQLKFATLNVYLLQKYFQREVPILTGLSETYLYRNVRQRIGSRGECIYDDIRGTPCGHFIVLCGYDYENELVIVADPQRENPLSHDNYYKVSAEQLISAIMLGVLTYDANLLIIQP